MEQIKTATNVAGNNISAKLKNVWFYVPIVFQVIISAIAGTGTKVESLQTWPAVWDMVVAYVSNPFLLSLLVIQIYGQLKSFDVKGPWRDSDLTNSKVAPTRPDMNVVAAGEPELKDDTVILMDNVDGEAVEEITNNESSEPVLNHDSVTFVGNKEEKYDPNLAGPEVYSNEKNSENEI